MMRSAAWGLAAVILCSLGGLLGACSEDSAQKAALLGPGGADGGLTDASLDSSAGAGGGSAGSSQGGHGGGGASGAAGGGVAGAGGGVAGAGGGSAGAGGGSAGAGGDTGAAIIADHHAAARFDSIPSQYVEAAKQQYRIYYPRTSHGSQIETGMQMLASDPGGVYQYPTSFMLYEYGDLGNDGDLTWVGQTHTQLDKPDNDRNMVIWPWSGGVRTATEAIINTYLTSMSQLEQQYPTIKFVYMTGHADQWSTDNVRARNQQIRDYCLQNGKVLYDFEDIESWDPAGNFYRDTGDDCVWCSTWCASHACPSCTECAHTHCFNCYLKGRAFWWMMARLAGWGG